MNIKLKKELLSFLLAGATVVLSTGCTNKVTEIKEEKEQINIDTEKNNISRITDELITEVVRINQLANKEEKQSKENEKIVDEDSIEYNTRKEDVVFITNRTSVYEQKDANTTEYADILEGRSFRYLGEDDEWYQIDFYGMHGYVPKSDGIKTYKYVMQYPMIEKGALTEETIVYADKEMTYPIAQLPKYEFLEIYRELEDNYLISTTYDLIGYIPKDNIKMAEGNTAVIDIKNQEVTIYEDNVSVFSYPCITGCVRDGTETPLGIYDIFKKRGRCSFSGVTVDYMHNFLRGYGIHTCDWKRKFGADVYENDGSHGCARSPMYTYPFVYNTLDVGNPVIVQEGNPTYIEEYNILDDGTLVLNENSNPIYIKK